jgi:hypothetical protein
MKQYRFYILLLTLIVALMPLSVFASDVSNAIWGGDIRVTNNSTATTAVSIDCSINSTALMDSGYTSSTLTDAAIQYNGSDIPFMPGYGNNPWILFIDSIGENQNLIYNIYTDDVTSGQQYIFMDNTGGTTADSASLEYSDNFTEKVKAYLSGSGNITLKEDAFTLSYDATTENVTASIYALSSSNSTLYLLPNASGKYTNIAVANPAVAHYLNVDDPVATPDDDATTVYDSNLSKHYDVYNLEDATTIPDTAEITGVTVFFRVKGIAGSFQPRIRLGTNETTGTAVSGAVGWVTHNETLSKPGGGDWTISDINDLQVGIGIGSSSGNVYCTQVYVAVTYLIYEPTATVTALNVEAGETEVTTQLNTPFFSITTADSPSANITPVSENLVMNAPLWQTDCSSSPFTTIDANGYSCTVSGATWAENEGYTFDNTNDYLTSANTPPSGAMSVVAWVKPTNAQSTLLNFQSSGSIPGFALEWAGSGRPILGLGSSNYRYFNSSAWATLSDGYWHHVVFTLPGSGQTDINNSAMYIDGVAQGVYSTSTTGAQDSRNLYLIGISRVSTPVNPYGGIIGELQVYDRVLSQSEIIQDFNATKSLYTTGDIYTVSTLSTVPDNANDIIDCPGSVTPYVESIERWIGGVKQQDISWEYDTTFTDASGNGHDMIPSFRTSSSDADVSATLISFDPETESRLSTFDLTSIYSILSGNVTGPDNMFSGGDYSLLPAGPINDILDEADVPRSAWWYPFIFLGISIIGMIVYGLTTWTRGGDGRLAEGQLDGSLIFMFIIMELLLVIFGKMGVIDYWAAYIYPIAAIAIILSKKHFSWG